MFLRLESPMIPPFGFPHKAARARVFPTPVLETIIFKQYPDKLTAHTMCTTCWRRLQLLQSDLNNDCSIGK
jgi:hypothetical protein